MNQEKSLREEYLLLQQELQNPDVFGRTDYPRLAKRQGELAKIIELFDERRTITRQLIDATDMLKEGDPSITELANQEIKELTEKSKEVNGLISEALVPKDPNDERDCVVEIRAAAGGDEASLFAGDLYRMYARWAEKHGLKLDLLSENATDGGGFKEVIFAVKGDEAYGKLKFEAGVHRVQRIPTTESQGRIHTSTATVAIMPEAEETDIEINPADLRIDVYRSGGNGGQSVNTTDSAVRITYLPTGMVVTCQDEKSQLKNKDKAMKVLRSRLLQKKIEEEQKQLSEAKRKLIGSGDRSEKIRTYNFPQDRITDHRIGYSRGNLPGALDGGIDDLIEELAKASHELTNEN